ncbi:MAG: ABC transporter ATP-binding protein [Deltaproteobacteria bacterium]|nr:ABC transporter ATP-binding protein [Deltaproteobacteria bacterium]
MNGVHVQIDDLVKVYQKGEQRIDVLSGIDLTLEPGDRVAVLGPSGSGKSTFLHLLGMLDHPTSGVIRLNGVDINRQPESVRDRLRNRSVGFVFQAHNLLIEHTALRNVMVPCRLAGTTVPVAEQRAAAVLRAAGLGERLSHKPGELSGGEQQRVALARALVMGPGLVLADEPTGNLDPGTADGVFELMLKLNKQLGSTLVVVTHSRALASRFPRKLRLDRGQFEET